MEKSDEDIKWENASEINHMTHQIQISSSQRGIVSKFLCIANEENYNKKLTIFKTFLDDIPNSKLFSDALQPIHTQVIPQWNRYDPIESTPLDHMLHGAYVRLPPGHSIHTFTPEPYHGSSKEYDAFYGKPIPDIFFRGLSILNSASPTIESFQKIYYIIKPFNYDFADLIEVDSMKFKLLDISNPKYVCLSHRNSKYKGYPTPIIKEGKIIPMMSDKEYTIAYRKYRASKKLEPVMKA